MVKIAIKANKEAVEAAESFGDFEDLRPGVYRFKLAECNDGHSKGDDGKPDKSRRRLEMIVRPVSMDREGKVKLDKNYGQLWDYISLSSEGAGQKRAQWAIALGAKPNAKGDINFSIENDPNKPGTDIGKEFIGRVKLENDLQGNPRPKLASVWPLTPATEDGDEFSDEVEDEDEGVDDPFNDDEAVEDEDELLTQDDLEAMDLKELGALAKDDFDLDPKASIVKVKGKMSPAKTKARLIEAILEAQGDVGEDDEDDEDPF